ncbi:hypothetical protein GW17_00005049 [Ensete ventricosum]|nr:hypothetical protein GW17_00005049 [Ensete ventricosum]
MSGAGQEEDKKPADQSAHINLKVKGQKKLTPFEYSVPIFRTVFFLNASFAIKICLIKRSTQLRKLMNAYCDRQSRGSGALRPRWWRGNGEIWIHVTRLLTTARRRGKKKRCTSPKHNTTKEKQDLLHLTVPYSRCQLCDDRMAIAWTPRRASRGPLPLPPPPRLLVSPLLINGSFCHWELTLLIRVCYAKPRIRLASGPKGKDSMPELSDPDHAFNPLNRMSPLRVMGSGNGNSGLGPESRILPYQKPA